jgi:hypothetical protein
MRPRRSRISAKRQDGHDLAGHRNVEAGDARAALFFGTLPDGDLPQHTVAGVHNAAPGDAVRIDIESGEAAALPSVQLAGIDLRNSQIAQAPEHYR